MAISRSGGTPPYFEYLINCALIPSSNPLSVGMSSIIIANFQWVQIPRYQRGISWGIDEVEAFLQSKSTLLGNVILSQFMVQSGQFANLPQQASNYVVLVDGLQRFAIGTMLLRILDPLVLSAHPTRQGQAALFASLAARVHPLSAIYYHNSEEFLDHPRRAIADQYRGLYRAVEQYVDDSLSSTNAVQFASLVCNTFLNKQIALDIYSGFVDDIQLMNTFLGLNTVRVDLGPVDLLRAYIVERAAQAAWPAQEIEAMENDFTGIFVNDDKPVTELLPFVAVVLDALSTKNIPDRVFPSWSSGLVQSDVENLLQFVRDFHGCQNVNNYFDEIRQCGSIPFASLLTHYYCQSVHHQQPKPTFLNGGSQEDADLHRFLLANYRVLFDGKIGRTRTYTESILDGSAQSLAAIADDISNNYLGRGLSGTVDLGWLRACLNKVDQNRAKRAFNAMLLPNHSQGWGAPYQNVLSFGARVFQYHIDHLIPKGLQVPQVPGSEQIDTLRNFAPLRANQNRAAKASNCSFKLGPNGIYDVELANYPNYHPYPAWLVNQHAATLQAPDLNDQRYLEPNQSPPIGDQRIDWIAAQLISRI